MKLYKIILSGGGTGGHIYPAIAIANELKARFPKSEFLFVGAKDKMEMQKVPQAGYKITGLWIAGIQRRLTFKNLLFPFKLLVSLLKSTLIINAFKPDVVIGTGGFASGPLLQVATMKGVPTLIQEQNSFPGITNKLLSKKVNKVCVAYKGLEQFFPKEKLILMGDLNAFKYGIEAVEDERQSVLKELIINTILETDSQAEVAVDSKRIYDKDIPFDSLGETFNEDISPYDFLVEKE